MPFVLTLFLIVMVSGRTFFGGEQFPIWKSSILPLLFSGNGIGAINSAGDLDDAHKVKLKIVYP